MTLGTSLFLIALGAVLRFAVTVTTHGFNLHTVGIILMIVGIVGLVISLMWMTNRRRVGVPVVESTPVVERDPLL